MIVFRPHSSPVSKRIRVQQREGIAEAQAPAFHALSHLETGGWGWGSQEEARFGGGKLNLSIQQAWVWVSALTLMIWASSLHLWASVSPLQNRFVMLGIRCQVCWVNSPWRVH